ncbi:hypothetical protein TNCV_3113911 [Trichonephila clavipes]|nr:hypothetical protein TNCV_3113911 [Trichonephila clavipes]
MDKLAHISSCLYPTLSIVVTGKRVALQFVSCYDQLGERFGDRVGQGLGQTPSVLKAQPPTLRSKKFNFNFSDYLGRKQKIFVLCNQQLSIPLHQIQGQYGNIEGKQNTFVFLDVTRAGFEYHGAAQRTGIHLKRRHGASSASNFFIVRDEPNMFPMCRRMARNKYHRK